MNKFIKYFSLLLIILILTGCGEKKQEEKIEELKNEQEVINADAVLKEALVNNNNLNSFSMYVEIIATVSADGSTMTIRESVTTDIDENGNSYEVTETTMFGETVVEENYAVVHEGILYEYYGDDEYWYYDTYEVEEETEEDEDIEKIFEAISDIKQEKSNIEGYTKVSARLSPEYINEMANKELTQDLLEETSEEENKETSEFVLDKGIKVYFHIKDGYVRFMEMDLGELLKAYLIAIDSYNDKMEFSAPTFVKFYNFNQIEPLTLPEELLEEDDECVENKPAIV